MVATLFNSVAFAFTRMNAIGQARFAKLESAKEEMKMAHIPADLQEKVEATYEHLWRFGGERDSLLRDDALSLDLRRNLAFHMYGPTIRLVAGFENIDNHSLKCLAQKIILRLYSPGDLLVVYGEVGTELFIIQLGSVQPLDEFGVPFEGVILGEGCFFGEACFLHPGTRRTASIRCFEFCRTLVLCLNDFEELKLSDQLAAIARESQRRTTMNLLRDQSNFTASDKNSVPSIDPSLEMLDGRDAEETSSHGSAHAKTIIRVDSEPANDSARPKPVIRTDSEQPTDARSTAHTTHYGSNLGSSEAQVLPPESPSNYWELGAPPGSCGDGVS